ncbi:zonadhesin-like [Agelaius tricolor]|uniref:zonadhesin-like n=1 Tax=Agelaius tricolor TaxID=9191 RepID=UPI0039F17989
MVTVPQTYMGRLCGLCGNYNGQGNDEFQLSSGQLAPDATAFGSAWKTTDTPCNDTCPKDECPTCTEEKVAVLQKPNYCGLLTASEGPFGSCHRIIDPIPYSQSCIHDLCLMGGDTHVLCQSVQSYVTACQGAGVTVGAWRTSSFCPPTCPANSTYSLCTNTCANICTGNTTTCPQTCTEGCQCHQSLKDSDTFPASPCTAAPRSTAGPAVPNPTVSQPWSPHGDPHFQTFDSLDFDFQGTCTYTMAESHGNDPGLVPFRVQAKNDIRGGIQSVSYVVDIVREKQVVSQALSWGNCEKLREKN